MFNRPNCQNCFRSTFRLYGPLDFQIRQRQDLNRGVSRVGNKRVPVIVIKRDRMMAAMPFNATCTNRERFDQLRIGKHSVTVGIEIDHIQLFLQITLRSILKDENISFPACSQHNLRRDQ